MISGITRNAQGSPGRLGGFGGRDSGGVLGDLKSPPKVPKFWGGFWGVLGMDSGSSGRLRGARNAQGELGTLKREDDRRSEAELSGDGQERSGGGGSAERSGAINGFFPLKNWFFLYENLGKSWKSS